MQRQIKKVDDPEAMDNTEEYIRLNLRDRDEIDFNFEADIEKNIIKKLDLNKMLNKDKKYIQQITDFITALYIKSYFPDALKAGDRARGRFDRIFTKAS